MPTIKTEARAVAAGRLTSPGTPSLESLKLGTGSSEGTEIANPNSDWLELESGDGHQIDVGAWQIAQTEDQNEPEATCVTPIVAISFDGSGQILTEPPGCMIVVVSKTVHLRADFATCDASAVE